ncbi:SPRY domain-containing protein 7-like [Ornithodoros turicata]|uniref:SPRY domain-containing protein 7 n=1 Tax=Ornithodoros turicata TaxID=34597 RepID=A0A2R5L453_9ACAR
MATCFGCIRRCFSSSGFNPTASDVSRLPRVTLDMLHMGQEVVIVKNSQRICGSGAALATAPLVQNKSYFEVKLQQTGVWGIGVATRKADLNRVPLGQDAESTVLTSERTVQRSKDTLHKVQQTIQEGDIIGVTYDHLELNFYLNGTDLHIPVTGIKGEVYPVLYVDQGAVLDAVFTGFYHTPPLGFEQVMVEQSLL